MRDNEFGNDLRHSLGGLTLCEQSAACKAERKRVMAS
jgi:hypothetical protein